jgi:AcrR family transcriptional regulator
MSPSLREKHADATRRALLRAARTLFARHGYEKTGVDQIAAHAGATRGAFYHHFEGKRELMRALLEELQGDLATRVAGAASTEPEPWDRLRTAIATFLDACAEPAIRRIVLEEAPAALGWETWREIDTQHYLGMTTSVMRELVERGEIRGVDPQVLAHLLLATLAEAALWIARSDAPDARQRADDAVAALLRGLAPAR